MFDGAAAVGTLYRNVGASERCDGKQPVLTVIFARAAVIPLFIERRAKAHFHDTAVCWRLATRWAVAFPGLGGDVKLGGRQQQ